MDPVFIYARLSVIAQLVGSAFTIKILLNAIAQLDISAATIGRFYEPRNRHWQIAARLS